MIKNFLQKCNIIKEEVVSLGYKAIDLEKVYKDFKKRQNDYHDLGQYIVKVFLQNHACFHSIKFRVKSPESLIKKIIQKKKKGISVKNYQEEITDLLGVRVLLLDRENRKEINKFIEENWDLYKKVAYYSLEEDGGKYNKFFTNEQIKQKDGGYSSLHYIINTKPTKQGFKAEIQVRSLLEEAWGEVDHMIQYKNDNQNLKQNSLKVVLNNLQVLFAQGNKLITLLCKFHQSKVLVKDLRELIRYIESSDLDYATKQCCIKEMSDALGINQFLNDDFKKLSNGLGINQFINYDFKKLSETINNTVNEQANYIHALKILKIQDQYKELIDSLNVSLLGLKIHKNDSNQ